MGLSSPGRFGASETAPGGEGKAGSSAGLLEYESEPEASEFDLGTKIRTPKDIMLEELSLQNNRGSKMFKMRQKRVERFIYENNPDIFSSESMVRAELMEKIQSLLLLC